jgi:hypothetical protein
MQLAGVRPKTYLSYGGFDELKQPLFSVYIPIDVGYFKVAPSESDIKSFVLITGERDPIPAPTTSIVIPDTAYSGYATINGDVFTDLPWSGGVPYSESTPKKVWIGAAAPPTPPPISQTAMLSISSATVKVDKDFTVDVNIKDVDADAHIVAIEFRVKFDTFLLDVVNVTEGDFVKQFGDTAMMWSVDGDVIVGVIQLPPWPGPNGWMTGSGTVAKITFHAKEIGASTLALTDAFMVNSQGYTVNFERLENGAAKISG